MPRQKAFEISHWHTRRELPARYMSTGKLRPCCICKKTENDGRAMYSRIRWARRYMAERSMRGRWDLITETTPDGETVQKEFIVAKPTNYHAECEAEDQRRRNKLRPKRRNVIETLRVQQEEMAEELRQLRAQLGSVAGAKPRPGATKQDINDAAKRSAAFPGIEPNRKKKHPPGSLADYVSQDNMQLPWFLRKDSTGSYPDPDSAPPRVKPPYQPPNGAIPPGKIVNEAGELVDDPTPEIKP